jgi:membrane-associated protease RseP (regulator of RpoE activity)
MTGPKHLWSGDWERESASAAEDLGPLTPPGAPEVPPSGATEPIRRPRRSLTTRQLGAFVAALIVAGAVVVLAVTLSDSKSTPSRTIAQSTFPFQVTPNGIVPNQTIPTPIVPTPTIPTPTTPTVPSPAGATQPPAPSRISNEPTVGWLGMEIVESPSGEVIYTVPAGSLGEADGFEPGDVIGTVNGLQVESPRQLRAALTNVRLGSQVQIEISRGSTVITFGVKLTARPTIQP